MTIFCYLLDNGTTMKNLLTVLVFVFFTTLIHAQTKYIKGKLTHLNAPLANAEVTVKDSDTKVKTNVHGLYSISAEEGDIIIYSYPSLETVEIIVEDVTSILNVSLNQKVTELDEVIVKGSNRKSQKELREEYPYDPNLIKTSWGILNKETAPGSMRILNNEDISDVGICILGVLRLRMSGVKVFGDCFTGGGVIIRGLSSINMKQTAVFDVDGQIFTDVPTWIHPSDMARVAVLSSMSLTGRYGSIGSGGVVVINTKVGVSNIAGTKILDRALLRNNIYQNDAIGKESVSKNLPSYLENLYSTTDLSSAKEVFLKNKNVYSSSTYYFIDSYNYFIGKGDTKFANQIIEDQKYLFEDHPVYAKALAYQFEANGKLELANDQYKKIFAMRPDYAQSYRDLAESYRDLGDLKKAVITHVRYSNLLKDGLMQGDSIIQTIIERDFDNLLVLKRNELLPNTKEIVQLKTFEDFEGTRLLFEWNDSEAEFELQFVNPEKHYYTWKHTMVDNAARIKEEKMKGYSCEDFLVDGSLPGRWRVNLNYKGNKKLEPTYLKVTTYHNYSRTSQRKEVNVYRLGLKNVNQQLFDLHNSNIVSTN